MRFVDDTDRRSRHHMYCDCVCDDGIIIYNLYNKKISKEKKTQRKKLSNFDLPYSKLEFYGAHTCQMLFFG